MRASVYLNFAGIFQENYWGYNENSFCVKFQPFSIKSSLTKIVFIRVNAIIE